MSAQTDNAVAILQRAVDGGEPPGWALAAGWGPDTEVLDAGGVAELVPSRRTMHVDTFFDVASLTKVAATLPIVLRLLHRGVVRLDTRVGDVLDASGVPQATVWHLLTHSAGLPPDPDPALRALAPQQLRAAITAIEPVAALGTTVAYSDVGFLLLGWIAETVTGTGLDELLAAEVTGPLGLSRTRYGPMAPGDDVAATEPRPDGTPVVGTVHDETAAALQGPAGHAGVFSVAADLAAYAAAWTDPSDDWLSRALRAEATRDQTAGLDGHRGLGWTARGDRYDQLGDAWPPTAVFHSGFTGTSLALDPPSGRWVVLLSNDVHLGRGRGTINPLRHAVHTALAP